MAEADNESENFFHLVKLIVDVGSEVLRDVLLHIIKPDTLDNVLQINMPKIDSLQRGRSKILFDNEYNLLTEKPPNSDKFDITLLVKIFRNLCPLICPKVISPKYVWGQSPGPNDFRLEDDIQRLREIRNAIFAHMPNTKVTDNEFQKHWVKITDAITRAAVYGSQGMKQRAKDKMDTIRTENVKSSNFKYHLEVFGAWYKADKKFENIEKQLKQQGDAVSMLSEQVTNLTQLDTKVQGLDEKVGEIAANLPFISEKQSITETDKLQLEKYLIDGYKDKLDVVLLPGGWDPFHVSETFTPSILVCDRKKENQKEEECRKLDINRESFTLSIPVSDRRKETQKEEKSINLSTFRALFYENNELQKRVVLLGEAGTGKTTFTKHLTDAWCETTKQTQFADVDVLKQFRYLFYISCRFAKEKETLLEMINNQLFNDNRMKEVALHMLQNYPERCLIVLDGADEWKGSPTSETGRRGDITGLPGMTDVEGCVILITSRPWRFHALPKKSKDIFRRLEINGVKDVKELAVRILQIWEDTAPESSSKEFVRQVREKNMFELMKIPLILIISLGVWVGDKSLDRSITINYINMIQSFIRRSKGQAGWLEFEEKLRKVNLDNLKSEKGQQTDKMLELMFAYKPFERYAKLFLLLGELAFDLLLGKEEQSLVFSQEVLKTYLPANEENDESLSDCLALGILSKTETAMLGFKRLESYAFCHKTFQEFFAALWLARNYSNEKLKLEKCIQSYSDLMSYEVLITFLCGLDPEAGRDFWKCVSENVKVIGKEEQKSSDPERRIKEVTDLVCKCMKEHEFDPKNQIYFCLPHIAIDWSTSDEYIILLRHVIEEYACSVKSLALDGGTKTHPGTVQLVKSVSLGAHLESLKLQHVRCREDGFNCCIPVLDLQKHNKLETLVLTTLSVESLLLPVEGARITSLDLYNVKMTHRGCEQLTGALLSYSGLEYLKLYEVRCKKDGNYCCIPVLDLQKHNKLDRLLLGSFYVKSLLLPVEGARITSLRLKNVTMTYHDCEQLAGTLLSCSGLECLMLDEVRCREDGDACFIPVLDLQKHNKLEEVSLYVLSVEGLLLPVEGARITSLSLDNVTMTHNGFEQLAGALLSNSDLECLFLHEVRCREDGDAFFIPVLDLQKHYKLKNLDLWRLSVKGLLLPVEGSKATSLKVKLNNVTMTHRGCEQLSGALSSYSSLEYLQLNSVRCTEHSDCRCIPVLDLQKHNKLNILVLWSLSVEGLLLPVEAVKLTPMKLHNVTMTHYGCEQLARSLFSRPELEQRYRFDVGYGLYPNEVKCGECKSTCQPVEDISKFIRSHLN